ncbi:hypothetical protein OGAPHI_000942 [Ogataea philodendri]|uniref:Uncharacterized protein n=1 Tax=Ogataea philodendri TaxID=1378263 RepID=A0A9P8PEB3_9ASCO|nr:uncharacterized protein OGAPHI_000942 [Ogataea philodendri]KAH3670427.1 hypothetical protein OGAPHI_000942 [Ogataea philodendri]
MLYDVGAWSASWDASSAINELDRTESKVVTPNSLRGLNVPFFLNVSAKTGTIELTGLVITRTKASGQVSEMAEAMSALMPALIWNRSSLVMPGFLGTPAGITTMSDPFNDSTSPVSPASDFRW